MPQPTHPDLNDVALFAKVVELGSFTAAASASGLPTSSLSRRISRLEKALGVRLLHRTTRSLRLTEVGEAFLVRARSGIGALAEAELVAREHGTEVRGTVRITAPVDLGTYVLPSLVASFTREHPGVRVELSLTGRTVDLVQEGYDLAIRAGKLSESSLLVRKLGSSSLGLWASPSYLERRGRPSSTADLASQACVLFKAFGVREGRSVWTLRRPSEPEERVEVSGPVTVDEMSFVLEAAIAGAGIGLLPHFVAARASSALERVLPDYTLESSPISLVSPPRGDEPRSVRLFRERLLREWAALMSPRGEASTQARKA